MFYRFLQYFKINSRQIANCADELHNGAVFPAKGFAFFFKVKV